MSPKNREGLYWSPQDDERLCAYKALPLAAAAFMLGRTARAIAQRRAKLGISKPKRSTPAVPLALVVSLAERFAAEVKSTPETVLGTSRKHLIAWARQQIMKELRREYSLHAIGHALGLDHSTVLYGLSRADRPCPDRVAKRTRRRHRQIEKIKPRPVRLILNQPAPEPKHPAVKTESSITVSRERLMAGR